MIQLEHLHIEEFRGIRAIELPLNSKSFVVHGPNGSGKSGVVDAIDFALTGNIGRLVGAGTGGVTLVKHGPHVHQRDNPAAAIVALTIRDVESGATAVLTRTIADPGNFTLEPDTPEMREAVAQAQAHPELTLSRREIIKYVVSKPADRAQEVQALLKLDRLDLFRRLLRSALTKTSSDLTSTNSELQTAEQSFMGHLDVRSLLATEIGRVINERRATLGLDALADVTIDTDFLEGITTDTSVRGFNLVTATKEVSELNAKLGTLEIIAAKRSALTAVLDELAAEPDLLDALKHRTLIEQGLSSIQSSACPLCDKEWGGIELLREHIQEKLARTDAAQELCQRINSASDEYKLEVRNLRDQLERAIPVSESRGDEELRHMLRTWSGELLGHIQTLTTIETLVAARDSLSVRAYEPSPEVATKLTALQELLTAEPDQSATDAARSFLTIAKDRWTRVRLARAAQTKTTAVRDTAKSIYDEYCRIADESLTTLYGSVETDFSKYYQRINPDDEGAFKAALNPAAGSLDLAVDFYGLGMFPPTAYHSEGHQDGMGVCLYLALVKQLLGTNFRYAVLDDVVMSVDVNHRRQFCELLKAEFPDVQFIITTHDEVWARQMQSAGLITSKMQARFYGWTVDGGPVYEQGDIWERIEEDLTKNDVHGAAHKLRRRLEAAAADIAEGIGGRVIYRGDATYDLSELLDAVKGRHSDLLKAATTAAESWNDDAARQKAATLKLERVEVLPEQQGENWIINTLVHNNDWVQTSPNDFRPVLEATRKFLDLFMCVNPDCGAWIYTDGRPEGSLRCTCGTYNLNLLKKP